MKWCVVLAVTRELQFLIYFSRNHHRQIIHLKNSRSISFTDVVLQKAVVLNLLKDTMSGHPAGQSQDSQTESNYVGKV